MISKIRKVKLGNYIELIDIRNTDNLFGVESLRGISIKKILTETKADTNNLDVRNYKIVKKGWFAYSLVTSRNGNKISVAYNDEKDCIVSQINPVFRIKDENELNPRYLMMFFNRPEFDRYSRFNSWGSARETFDWNEMCSIELELPSINVQLKYVSIYESLLSNLKCYEAGLNNLAIAYQALIESYKKTNPLSSISPYIEEVKETNKQGKYGRELLRGVGQDGFIDPKQKRDDNSLMKCGVFHKNDFVYNPSVLYAGAIALNKELEHGICTEEYVIFHSKNETVLLPEYLFMWIKRKECGRMINFMSIDSVRNRIYFQDLKMIEIPIVDLEHQKYAVDIFNAYTQRKGFVTELKRMISNICPILVRGSILEAKGDLSNAK